MIAHLVKLIWNRKRANALILTELLVAFLVLAGLGTAAGYYWSNYRRPLGYTVDRVWIASIGHGISYTGTDRPERVDAARATARRLLETVRALPEVEALAGAYTGPIVSGSRSTQDSDGQDIPAAGRGLSFDVDTVSDDFPAVFGIGLVAGRWFGKEDDGAGYWPMVINEQLAHDFFGAANPVGQRIGTGDRELPVRVVGVIGSYRQRGALAPPIRYAFRRYRPESGDLPFARLFVKTRPGTDAHFEDTLDRRLRATAGGDWSFYVRSLPLARDAQQRVELMPLAVAAIIATFLMLMVVLGLTGVLWQNVTQRTKEIGLRRAKGATRPAIHGQIQGELMVMTTIAVAAGVLLIAHLLFLRLIGNLDARLYLEGAGAAALLLYLITVACGFYPARLAARVQPALALRAD
jgi:putative ABC transport system permease protein